LAPKTDELKIRSVLENTVSQATSLRNWILSQRKHHAPLDKLICLIPGEIPLWRYLFSAVCTIGMVWGVGLAKAVFKV